MQTRSSNWVQIVYPESLPDNWLQILDNLHIAIAVSPLHDPDQDSTKAHYHIIYRFDSLKSVDQVKQLSADLCGTAPFICNSINAYTRYLTHMDHPEKQQFEEKPILLGGYDYDTLIEANSFKRLRYERIKEMCLFIQEHNITEFYMLVDYAMMERFDDWLPLLADNSAFIVGEYIKSWRNSSLKK